ncbi:hypothetical protein O1L55_02510 [Streptomyces albulus]|nr:hypothetical protein [Streptomyces noursei]
MEHGPRVHPDLVQYLADLGFEWEPRANGRACCWPPPGPTSKARAPAPRLDESIGVDGEEVALGALLAERRRPGITDTELEEIGVWRVPRRCRGRLPSTVSSCG